MLTGAERRALLSSIAAHGGPFAKAPEPPDAFWRVLEAELRPARVEKGGFFIRPGESAGRVALVRSGLLRFYYIDAGGAEFTKAFRGPGEMASAFAELLLGVPSRTHVQALEDCELLVADFARLDGALSRFQEWTGIARLIAEHFYVVKERREFELLQLSARERYDRFESEYPGVAARIPQYHVASYLGITPVALSRIRGAARRGGRARGTSGRSRGSGSGR